MAYMLEIDLTKGISITLKKSMVRRIDSERKDVPRSKYISRILERGIQCLGHENGVKK